MDPTLKKGRDDDDLNNSPTNITNQYAKAMEEYTSQDEKVVAPTPTEQGTEPQNQIEHVPDAEGSELHDLISVAASHTEVLTPQSKINGGDLRQKDYCCEATGALAAQIAVASDDLLSDERKQDIVARNNELVELMDKGILKHMDQDTLDEATQEACKTLANTGLDYYGLAPYEAEGLATWLEGGSNEINHKIIDREKTALIADMVTKLTPGNLEPYADKAAINELVQKGEKWLEEQRHPDQERKSQAGEIRSEDVGYDIAKLVELADRREEYLLIDDEQQILQSTMAENFLSDFKSYSDEEKAEEVYALLENEILDEDDELIIGPYTKRDCELLLNSIRYDRDASYNDRRLASIQRTIFEGESVDSVPLASRTQMMTPNVIKDMFIKRYVNKHVIPNRVQGIKNSIAIGAALGQATIDIREALDASNQNDGNTTDQEHETDIVAEQHAKDLKNLRFLVSNLAEYMFKLTDGHREDVKKKYGVKSRSKDFYKDVLTQVEAWDEDKVEKQERYRGALLVPMNDCCRQIADLLVKIDSFAGSKDVSPEEKDLPQLPGFTPIGE